MRGILNRNFRVSITFKFNALLKEIFKNIVINCRKVSDVWQDTWEQMKSYFVLCSYSDIQTRDCDGYLNTRLSEQKYSDGDQLGKTIMPVTSRVQVTFL